MGKQLIIRDADFSENALINIGGLTDLSGNMVLSDVNRQFLHYPDHDVINSFAYTTNLSNTRICTLDVSQYVGRTIRIRIWSISKASDYTGGAYWMCFASAFSVAIPWTGTTSTNNVLTTVSYISGLGGGEYNIIDIEVPIGAMYFVGKYNIEHPTKVYLVDE